MARKLKPQKVSEVKHRGSGVVVPIHLDRNELDFFADFGGQRFRAGAAKELRRELWLIIDESIRLEWHPVIEVKALRPFATRSDGFVGFETERFLWARRHDGTLARIGWSQKDVADKYRHAKTMPARVKMQEEFDPPYRDDQARVATVYLPYTDDLWVGLQELVMGVSVLKDRLTELLLTKEGQARLAEVGQAMVKALPAPEPGGNDHEEEGEADGHQ